ncbi:MAG TPA: hypothetical protein VMM58_08640, partial [Bacteroidota bacterium]|nr:hypothetical protein [Bacteroidota bacterium]
LDTKEETLENFITSQETTTVTYGSSTIPLGYALGLQYQPSERTILTGDAQFQQWGDYKYLGVHPSEIRNSTRFGVGAEFLPEATFGDAYFHQVTYRVGAYTLSSYLALNGQTIDEHFITGGIGIPIFFSPGSEARLNITLEYGIQGTTSSGLERNNITRLTISINGSDTWFIPTEID